MRSEAKTVDGYLAELPRDRREAISAVWRVIVENLPDGYEEAMNWGMITYQVPLSTYPETYNKQPLMYAALASQKNHMAVYLSASTPSKGGAPTSRRRTRPPESDTTWGSRAFASRGSKTCRSR